MRRMPSPKKMAEWFIVLCVIVLATAAAMAQEVRCEITVTTTQESETRYVTVSECSQIEPPGPPKPPVKPPVDATWESSFEYAGAFRPYNKPFGPTFDHMLRHMNGAITVYDDAQGPVVVQAAHGKHNHLVRYRMPALVKSVAPSEWNFAQSIIDWPEWPGRPDGHHRITGLVIGDAVQGKRSLLVQKIVWYNAKGDNTHGTKLLADVDNLATGAATDWLDTPGELSRGMCSVSKIPANLQGRLEGTHVFGGGVCRSSILGRHCMGPCAHVANLPTLETTRYAKADSWTAQDYYPRHNHVLGAVVPATASYVKLPEGVETPKGSISNPFSRFINGGIDPDMSTEAGRQMVRTQGAWPFGDAVPMWTVRSSADLCLITPDGIYWCVGRHEGEKGGIGYKGPPSPKLPNACLYKTGGPCLHDRADKAVVFWQFDTSEWGNVAPHLVVPMHRGRMPEWLQRYVLTGGYWDAEKGRLYLTHNIPNSNGSGFITVWDWKGA